MVSQRGFFGLLFTTIIAVGLAGCGATNGVGTSAGQASNSSLSSTPSADLSTLDTSQSSSTSISLAPKGSSLSVSKADSEEEPAISLAIGDGLTAKGSPSRAGCEVDSQKEELFRMAQQAQLDRCYLEAMNTIGLIDIEKGFKYLRVATPSEQSTERGSSASGGGTLCNDIPTSDETRRTACLRGDESHNGGILHIRYGLAENEDLLIDVYDGDQNKLLTEATYSVNGSVYTIKYIRKGTWGGSSESTTINATIDLGTTGSVSNGVVSLGNGNASATAAVSGAFGVGNMTFTATNSFNTFKGAFSGEFTDFEGGCMQEMLGKVSAKFDSNSGCAAYWFRGDMCSEPISVMLPLGASVSDFLTMINAQLGLAGNQALTVANYASKRICFNPNFDPTNPSATVKPFTITTSLNCDQFTHTGREAYTIKPLTVAVDNGTTVENVFTIANDADIESSYVDYCKSELTTITNLSAAITTPAFSRNWNGQPETVFTSVDINSVMADPTKKTLLETAIKSCKAIEEKLWRNRGMGDYACDKQMMKETGQDLNDSPPSNGDWGGQHTLAPLADQNPVFCGSATHSAFASGGAVALSFNVVDSAARKYCLVDGSANACREFTLDANGDVSGISLALNDQTITQIDSNGTKCNASGGGGNFTLYFGSGARCIYNCAQPSYTTPSKLGASRWPQACLSATGFDPTAADAEEVCNVICSKPGTTCTVQ